MTFNKRTARLRRARKNTMKAKRLGVEKGYPRLRLFRSNRNIGAQIIDPISGNVLASISSLQLRDSEEAKQPGKLAIAKLAGRTLAQKAKENGVSGQLVCDRAGYIYHGRIAAFLDGVREVKEIQV